MNQLAISVVLITKWCNTRIGPNYDIVVLQEEGSCSKNVWFVYQLIIFHYIKYREMILTYIYLSGHFSIRSPLINCIIELDLYYYYLSILILLDMTTWQFFLNDLLCGSVAGVANCLTGFMLDTVKVRMQTEKIGMVKCMVNIFRNQGFLAFYSGIYYPIVTVPLGNAVSFSSYELYKNVSNKKELSFWNGVEAGAFSGLVGCSVITPVELIKCKMQVASHQFKSSPQCFKYVIKEEGLRGLYRGNFSTMMREIPSMGTQFATYQFFKALLLKKSQKDKLTFSESILTGGMAGFGAWINSYPQDVIKTRIQVNLNSYAKSKWIPDGGFISAAKQIYAKQGIKGFFQGFSPCMLRAFIANSAMIAGYEWAQGIIRPRIF